jgi:hypothetical protein
MLASAAGRQWAAPCLFPSTPGLRTRRRFIPGARADASWWRNRPLRDRRRRVTAQPAPQLRDGGNPPRLSDRQRRGTATGSEMQADGVRGRGARAANPVKAQFTPEPTAAGAEMQVDGVRGRRSRATNPVKAQFTPESVESARLGDNGPLRDRPHEAALDATAPDSGITNATRACGRVKSWTHSSKARRSQ